MRLLGWRRRRNTGDDEFPQGLDVALARDERLSAYLDSELDEREAVAVEDALGADPVLATQLDELRVVRAALGSLGELRAPRPFTIEAPPTAVRHTPGRLELIFRMGAVAAAVAFAVVLTGDFVGLGNEGVEGWGVSRPSFGGGESEQASDAPQALSAVAPEAATAASTPQTAPTPVATVAQAAATVAATATPAATSAPTAAAAAAATAQPTAAQAAKAPDAAPTTDSRAAARTREPSETAEAPSAGEAPAPTAAGQGSEAAPAATAATEADGAADEADGTDATEAAPPAAATAAAAAATPEPAALATAPATGNQTMMGEAEGGDDGARALRRAEQWLLLAAVALAVLALGLGLRRRGNRA